MGVFSVPVTIGVDEERIAKEIEKNVEDRVVENITNKIEDIICPKDYFGKRTNNKLNDFVLNEIRKCVKDNEDLIIQEASKYLAEKMAKTKAVKEAIKYVVEQNKQ